VIFFRDLLLAGAVLASGVASTRAADYADGVDFTTLSAPLPTAHPNQVEVLEAFSFGCPHCYHFEPNLNAWLKKIPDGVYLDRIPAEFNRFFALMARVYYTVELLGAEQSMHSALFDAIHKERRDLRRLEAVADFMAEHGVDRDLFLKTAHSFAVETKLRRAAALYPRYGIRGVPTMIVNGKYVVEAKPDRPPEKMMKIVSFLVHKVLLERKSSS